MKNLIGQTNEEKRAVLIAATEKDITAKNIIEELFFTLEECFIGNLNICNDSVKYELPNGQSFNITVTEE